jgi:hypothetical protein
MRRNNLGNLGKKIKLFFYIFLVIFFLGSYLFFKQIQKEYVAITTFEECVDAGYPVLTTYPEQCKIPGKIFTNLNQTKETDNKEVVIATPEKNMNPKNTSYDIEGERITLQNGVSIVVNSLSLAKETIKYFGKELRLDVNGDGKEDTAFLLTLTTEGTGTFYYLVVALNKDGGYVGTNGALLGDRIVPQTTEFRNGEIVVTYLDRKPDEPVTAKPTVVTPKYFKIENDTLVEIQK